ncbi:CGNR zinc finger domain-containing protein [Streptacidiphilus carbonis]|jgi:predicted RNA-binding Zn ribbon-like protein|uniref:CGNR zinc finger domain-containing protein n=1 Tax=Streptacidiphilus carbonis TaxID=105422 RepID=UPI0005AA38C1|nr:ABATE domain-containing protein [Streptacidiphilus carbonis]
MTVTTRAAGDAADRGAEAVRFREGAGRLSLDFIRTLRYRGTLGAVEELADVPALVAWIVQCGPCALEPDPALVRPTEVRDARSLREAVHELIAAGLGPGGVASSSFLSRELVNRAAAVPAPTPRVDPSGALLWIAADPVAATLSLVARDAVDLVTSPAILRVRECADPTCGALFVDNSRPGNRRWCSMGACGNRAKKSTIRKKAAQGNADKAERDRGKDGRA